MPQNTKPIEGCWYESNDNGDIFFVIMVDEDDGVIEIQSYDGDLDELELAEWQEMDLEAIEQPEDFHGSIDGDLDDETVSVNMKDMDSDSWEEPLSNLVDE